MSRRREEAGCNDTPRNSFRLAKYPTRFSFIEVLFSVLAECVSADLMKSGSPWFTRLVLLARRLRKPCAGFNARKARYRQV